MEISLTWGDIAVHTGIALLVAVLGYIAPRSFDYWARQNKIARLEQRFAQYQADFADSRLFIARMLRLTVMFLLPLLVALLLFQLYIENHFYKELICKIDANACKPFSEANFNAFVFQVASFLAFFWAGLRARTLALELSPERYRSYQNNRIARLRARVRHDAAALIFSITDHLCFQPLRGPRELRNYLKKFAINGLCDFRSERGRRSTHNI
jgi:hypothetical protein